MASIKKDFVGVVYAYNKAGALVKLRAGDAVPAGVNVREDIVTQAQSRGGARGKNTGDSGSDRK